MISVLIQVTSRWQLNAEVVLIFLSLGTLQFHLARDNRELGPGLPLPLDSQPAVRRLGLLLHTVHPPLLDLLGRQSNR